MAGIGGQIAGVLGFMINFYELLTGSYETQFIPHCLFTEFRQVETTTISLGLE